MIPFTSLSVRFNLIDCQSDVSRNNLISNSINKIDENHQSLSDCSSDGSSSLSINTRYYTLVAVPYYLIPVLIIGFHTFLKIFIFIQELDQIV